MLKWRYHSVARLYGQRCVRFITTCPRLCDSQNVQSRTRNIGIIAHIDAGKTTTTERMLYYSGHTRRIGDVDDGSTVTDFLPAERARGITIQSAAISFNWPPTAPEENSRESPKSSTTESGTRLSSLSHNINLIDTPGHADFTFEVLRSLRVLDGAICILDGVAGVEAQTEKVWHQASQYQIPRIVYVNKLDRDGATFNRTVKEIGAKLHVWPAVCEIPWWREGDKKFCGVGDAVGLRAMLWEEGSDGRTVKAFDLKHLEDHHLQLATELKRAREALVERLSEHDEQMVEKFLECDEDHLAISEADIIASLRRCTLQFPQQVAPVYAGASFRNIGVQPLLDAVVDLLPSPMERPDAEITLGKSNSTLSTLLAGKLGGSQSSRVIKPSKARSTAVTQNVQSCALAFKVVNDMKRGVLVYVRVYAGSLGRGAQLFNTNLKITERAPRLLRMYASDAIDIPSIDAGQIGVIVGLKHARTGDTLLSYTGMNAKTGPPSPLDSLQLRPIAVPPPVFFTSVEPESLAMEKHIKDTLDILLREDPSLSVSIDAENGQTHLAGMGELHLEIARDRLINDFKAKARTGRIDINYREAAEASSKQVFESTIDHEIGGKHAHAAASCSIAPLANADNTALHTATAQEIRLPDNNLLTILHPTLTSEGVLNDGDEDPFPPHLTYSMAIAALESGVSAALARGPTHGFPVHGTHVTLNLDPETQIFPDTNAAALLVAAREATQGAMKASKHEAEFVLMEPVMAVTISVGEIDLGAVVHDLSSARGGQIISLDDGGHGSTASPLATASSTDTFEPNDPLMIDTKLIYAPPDPYASEMGHAQSAIGSTRPRNITARVPLREMVGYLRHLRSLTGGRGTFVMQVDRFEKVSGQRLQAILKEITG